MGAADPLGAGPPGVVLVGCGAMGRAVARHLAASPDVGTLVLVDARPDRAARLAGEVARAVPGATVETSAGAPDRPWGEALMRWSAAVVVGCAPWTASAALLEDVVERGGAFVGIARPDYAALPELRAAARRSRARVAFPVGLEPGLTEILSRRALRALDGPIELHVRCGGLSAVPRGPLRHTLLFGDELAVADRPAYTVRDGRLSVVDRFSGLERLHVPGVGLLEAYHDGLIPAVAQSAPFDQLRAYSQKTLRWPGFAERIRLLHELGLLADRPVDADGATVRPKRVVEAVLREDLVRRPGEPDITALIVEARAAGGRVHRITLVDRHDPAIDLTSMARVTGFTCGLVAAMVARGELAPDGVALPHELLEPAQEARLLEGLRAASVEVAESAG